MRSTAVLAAVTGIWASTALAVVTNLGQDVPLVFSHNVLTASPSVPGTISILYAPSEDDDPAYRAAIAAVTGGVVDYFDARAATPTLAQLQRYSCVHTWANSAYSDNVAYGDALADYVDAGGHVVLGAFCTYTSGNFLSGRIMGAGYSPVFSPSGTNHFSSSAYAGDGFGPLYADVNAFSCVYRDFLSLQGGGSQDGSYLDSEMACAFRSDGKVVYANGQGGYPVTCTGDSPRLIANACGFLGGPRGAPAPATSYAGLIALIIALAGMGIVRLATIRARR